MHAHSPPLSSSARDLDVGSDDLTYGTKQGETSVGNGRSETDCELIDLGRFAIAVGDVGNPNFWGDEIKKTIVRLAHSSFLHAAK